jgi:D-alanyl-D-alanine carboxypeptidase/D-alanyl-D-alanine-endopeptidase (penicillin-binding protein 4)
LAPFVLFAAACYRPPPRIAPPPLSGVSTASLQKNIDQVLASPSLARGTWGILVKSASRDDTLYTLNAERLMTPASTLKVVTLAVAAERLGWDFRFRTELLRTGIVRDGVLHGDLIVRGFGDPTLDNWDGAADRLFDDWATRLRQLGVRTVAGRIIGDDDAFEDDGLGNGWAWDDLGSSYATAVSALQFNENSVQIVVRAGATAGERPQIEVRPESARVSVRNLLATTIASLPPVVSVRRLPPSAMVEVRGTVPAGSAPLVRSVSVPNPTLYFATAFRDALFRNEIDVNGPAVDVDDLDERPREADATRLAEVVSAPLTDVAQTMMKLSQNLFAETLLKALGMQVGGIGSAEAGLDVVREVLTSWGVSTGELFMVDGSGLSRYNLVTPAALVRVLDHIYRADAQRDRFVKTLPRAGVDGTLAERMKEGPAFQNATAKTGSFSNARGIAGYVRGIKGEPLIFVILANNYGVERRDIDAAFDSIVTALARFAR